MEFICFHAQVTASKYLLNPLLQNIPDQVLEFVIADQLHGDVFRLLVPGPHLQDGGKV